MTDFNQAHRDYTDAKFARDWAAGIVWYADIECSMSINQPVEFYALEEALEAYEDAEVAASEELDWYEQQARSIHLQGGCSTPSRYL